MNTLLKYFASDNTNSIIYTNWFVKNFPESEFIGVNKVLYYFLSYCSVLGISARKSHLVVYLETELKNIVREHNIKIDSVTASFDYNDISAFTQAVQTISTTTFATYEANISGKKIGDIEEFKVELARFMTTNLQAKIQSVFTEQYSILTQGGDSIEVAQKTRYLLQNSNSIYDLKKISDLDFALKRESETQDNVGKAKLICKTRIPAIDEDYGGLFSRALITFAGQPGSGKTRFLISVFVYHCLVDAKVGVLMHELELEDYEINNMLISIHIASLYKVKIPDKDINRGYLSDEQLKIVESARIDLFESGKYGRFKLSVNNLYIEDMYDEAINFLRLNSDIKVWCCDYIGRIRSLPSSYNRYKNKADIIDQALMDAKDIAKKADVCSICVNQYNDEGNKAAYAGKPITVGMIQGGQSIQRHSDYDIAITFTDEQEAARLRMISTTKVRSAVGYRYVPLETDLAICRFTQINKVEGRA